MIKEVRATLEWHWYCPFCERSCLSRFQGVYYTSSKICSDCGNTYKVITEPSKEEDDHVN